MGALSKIRAGFRCGWYGSCCHGSALHLYYDFSISRYLNAQRKPGEPPPGKLFGLLRYAEIMRENTRRFENGDPMARVVTYYDWAIAGAFVLLVAYRVLLALSRRRGSDPSRRRIEFDMHWRGEGSDPSNRE